MKLVFTITSLLFTFLSFPSQAACNPCVCGFGGENPWPPGHREWCQQNRNPRPTPVKDCISHKTAADILEVNINFANTNPNNETIDPQVALRAMNFSIRHNQFLSDIILEGRKERLSVSCLGQFQATYI